VRQGKKAKRELNRKGAKFAKEKIWIEILRFAPKKPSSFPPLLEKGDEGGFGKTERKAILRSE
jgi:hypothetical protein